VVKKGLLAAFTGFNRTGGLALGAMSGRRNYEFMTLNYSIDDNTVITGSFNFTKAAEEKNAENIIVFQDNPKLAEIYTRNWRTHKAHSVAYTGPRVHQADSDRSKPQPGNAGFACGNKTKCSQMISCEEARFYLTRCSVRSLDKDGNGVPCEALCK
jgi:hypothetical protein